MKEKIRKLLEHIYDVGYAIAEGQELYLSQEEIVNQATTQILQAFKDILPKEIDWDWADTPNYNDAIKEIKDKL